MKKNTSILLLIVLVTASLAFIFSNRVQAADCPPDSKFGCLEAPLPNFTEINIDNLVAPGSTPFTTIAGYIVNFMIALTVGCGVIAIVVGGYFYMTDGGDGGRVGTAKKIIMSGLIGIFLALSAYVLLNTISSQFTDVKEPQLGCFDSGDCRSGYHCVDGVCTDPH